MKKNFILLTVVMMGATFFAFAGDPADGKTTEKEVILPENAALAADTLEEEEEKAFPLTFGFDLVSRYVWRGVDFGKTPAFQPGLAYSVGNDVVGFELGAWASYSFTGNFAEMDLYATLSFPYVYVGIVDYFFPNENIGDDNYFQYDENTLHVYEGIVGFEGPEKFPLSAFFAYNFHSPVSDPDNSMYFELSYPFSLRKGVGLDVFVGGAEGSYYTQDGDFNIVNVGITASKDINIKDKVIIPLSVSLIGNPDAEKLHFVAAVGLWNQ